MKPDDSLDELFAAARSAVPDTARVEYGFETRLLARLRAERADSWLAWGWKLCPYFAALALAAGGWAYAHADSAPDEESLFAAVKTGGLPVLKYYLSSAE